MQGLSLQLPGGYNLERDPDLLILRRPDGSMVGAFSPRGAASGAVQRTPREAFEETRAKDLRSELAASRNEEPIPVSIRPSLQVRFFGHFEMLRDGELLALGRNGKALIILKYLLAHRSHPVSQDHLMGWLWPHSSLKKARWSLNSAIHSLRKLLSDCPSSSGLLRNYLLREEGFYRLCPSVHVQTDVEQFDERYERGQRLEKAGRAEEAAAEYGKAIALYRGDYLIEDLYDDWTMIERERLSNARIDMLNRMAVYHLHGGQYQESIRACYRVLEKDRCHEDSFRILMRCYAHLGLRESALRQYRLCEKILGQDYGMVPSPETRALYRNLSSQQANS